MVLLVDFCSETELALGEFEESEAVGVKFPCGTAEDASCTDELRLSNIARFFLRLLLDDMDDEASNGNDDDG